MKDLWGKLKTAVMRPAGRAQLLQRLRWTYLIWFTGFARKEPVVCRLSTYGEFVVHPDDTFSLEVFLSDGYEPLETRTLVTLLSVGDVVIDGGANIGYYTILASRLVGPRGRVISVEPGPVAYARLRRAIDTLSLSNVRATQAAITRIDGPVQIFLSLEGRHAQQSLAVWSGLGGKCVPYSVAGTALDSLVRSEKVLGNLAFIKLDLEGAEVAALEGARLVLADIDKPVIMVEVNVAALEAQGQSVTDLAAFFSTYECWGARLNGTAERLSSWDWSFASRNEIWNVFAFPKDGKYSDRLAAVRAEGLLGDT